MLQLWHLKQVVSPDTRGAENSQLHQTTHKLYWGHLDHSSLVCWVSQGCTSCSCLPLHHITAQETDNWTHSCQMCMCNQAICGCMSNSQLSGQCFSTWFALIQSRKVKILNSPEFLLSSKPETGENMYLSILWKQRSRKCQTVCKKAGKFQLYFLSGPASSRSKKTRAQLDSNYIVVL